MGLVILVTAVLASVTACVAALAAHLSGEAVRAAARERRRDHLARVGEAAVLVQQAARRYQAVMARQMEQVNGSRRDAEASGVVLAAVARYREACERLAVARAGGPQYRQLDGLLARMGDHTRPEEVALSGLSDLVLEQIGVLQGRLDRDERRPPALRALLGATVARRRSVLRLRWLGRTARPPR